jgi:hypothetical protein
MDISDISSAFWQIKWLNFKAGLIELGIIAVICIVAYLIFDRK